MAVFFLRHLEIQPSLTMSKLETLTVESPKVISSDTRFSRVPCPITILCVGKLFFRVRILQTPDSVKHVALGTTSMYLPTYLSRYLQLEIGSKHIVVASGKSTQVSWVRLNITSP